mgnify:CR=1 FL=1
MLPAFAVLAFSPPERQRWVAKMGVLPDAAARLRAAVEQGLVHRAEPLRNDTSIPGTFDSAAHWPECAKVINDIRDQGNCGCCWAFAGAEAASDRACIATGGKIAQPLSAGAVCFSVYNGCGGGDMHTPWLKVQAGEVVSGAQSNNSKSDPFADDGLCYPYPLPHCRHHVGESDAPYPLEGTPGCPDLDGSPTAPGRCDASARPPHDNWDKDGVTFDGQVVVHPIDEAAVKRAIMAGGPVAASMDVLSDFPTYKSGVYVPKSSDVLGSHAVRIVGWGVDQGKAYWRVANSWNTYWGESGFFRIAMGNTCGLLDTVVASSDDATWKAKAS